MDSSSHFGLDYCIHTCELCIDKGDHDTISLTGSFAFPLPSALFLSTLSAFLIRHRLYVVVLLLVRGQLSSSH